MDDVLHANIFFFITSVATIAVTLLLLVILWQVIGILREVKKIAARVSKASEGLERDIEFVRSEIRRGATRVSDLVSTVGGFFLGGIGAKKRAATKKRPSSEQENSEVV